MSRSDVSAFAAGALLGAAATILWKLSAAERPALAAPRVPPAPIPDEAEDKVASPIMTSELERLAGVAVSHGGDDPALDVFLAFVGALDPSPDAATLQPAAQRIGEPWLIQALDRPGEARLGARRLLAATFAEEPSPVPARSPGPHRPATVTVERPVGAERRLPELFEALLHAIRVALSILG